jgi:hypothetical protein
MKLVVEMMILMLKVFNSHLLFPPSCKAFETSAFQSVLLIQHKLRVTHHTSQVTHHTSHVTHHQSHVTRHTSHVTRHTLHVTCHTSHVTRHTSHVTRHTSHVTRHTSHVTRQTCIKVIHSPARIQLPQQIFKSVGRKFNKRWEPPQESRGLGHNWMRWCKQYLLQKWQFVLPNTTTGFSSISFCAANWLHLSARQKVDKIVPIAVDEDVQRTKQFISRQVFRSEIGNTFEQKLQHICCVSLSNRGKYLQLDKEIVVCH